MKITESRANDILHWLDDEAENHALLFEKMTLHRDAAALIRQLQAELQDAWHAGLDAGREQGRGDHAQQPPAETQPGWYCAHCQRDVDAREVTYSEHHDVCGRYIANDDPPPSVPVGVEWPLSLLRAGHWREVHAGRRYMRLEVTYDYAAWERLMEQVEAALAQQPAAVDGEVEGLPRYGFPDGNEPRPVPCADGYWTPWHLAQQPSVVPVGVEASQIADELEAWAKEPFVDLTPMRRMDIEGFANRIRALTQQPAAVGQIGRDEALLRKALEVLSRAHQAAMVQTLKARIPECAEFGGIAQDLDFVVAALRERLGEGAEP